MMGQVYKKSLVAILMMSVAGCGTIANTTGHGMPPLIVKGDVSKEFIVPTNDSSNGNGLISTFSAANAAAYNAATGSQGGPSKSAPSTTASPSSTATPNGSDLNWALADEGFNLVDSLCGYYFDAAGASQRDITVTKDAIAAITAVLAGALSLARADQNVTAAVGIASGAGLSGLTVYEKNFLFAAENIDSVRELTNKALRAHRDGLLSQKSSLLKFTYSDALLQIYDHQTICSYQRIRALVRDAIKSGEVKQSNTKPPAQTDTPPAPTDTPKTNKDSPLDMKLGTSSTPQTKINRVEVGVVPPR